MNCLTGARDLSSTVFPRGVCVRAHLQEFGAALRDRGGRHVRVSGERAGAAGAEGVADEGDTVVTYAHYAGKRSSLTMRNTGGADTYVTRPAPLPRRTTSRSPWRTCRGRIGTP
eukprot:5235150-Prymnesium_polylepis.1